MPDAHIHLKLWLTRAEGRPNGRGDGAELVGQGRVELLRRMAEMGSLKKAAESMGMSYRLAWGRLKKMEEALGSALVESGENRRGGYRLTPAGEDLITAFRQWEDEVRRFALERAPHLPNLNLIDAVFESAGDVGPRDPADPTAPVRTAADRKKA